MKKQKFGIFYDLYRRSDLEFMREAALDPGDGGGSYSKRDKMLMLMLKAAMGSGELKGDRKALIWLIKHLTWESKARMTMRKETQTIYIRENPDFASPAPALDILDIGWLQVVDVDLKTLLCPLSEDSESKRFQDAFPLETSMWREIARPIGGHIEPWFLEAALARKRCPQHARQQIEKWLANGALQPLHQQRKGLPPNPLEAAAAPRRSREDCWFKPGQSGNPRGRPKGSMDKSKRVRPDFFDEIVTVKYGRKKMRLTRRQAFLRRVEEKAIGERDYEIMRLLLDRHIDMSKLQAMVPYHQIETVALSIGGIRPNSLEGAIHALGGGELLYANKSTARMLLEPWVIELGLAHLGDRRLSREQQRVVLLFSRRPKQTRWPSWWDADLQRRVS